MGCGGCLRAPQGLQKVATTACGFMGNLGAHINTGDSESPTLSSSLSKITMIRKASGLR